MEISEQIEFLKKRAHSTPYKNRAWCHSGVYKNSYVFINNSPLTYDNYQDFDRWHYKEDINNYVLCFVPMLGYKFIKKSDIDDTVVFTIGAPKRRELLWLIAKGNAELFDKYLNLWNNRSEEIEYQLWLYNNDRANYEWYRQALDDLLYKEERTND